MKKILLLSISLLLILCAVFGLSSCNKNKDDGDVTYKVDTTDFNPVVVAGENLALNGLKLVGSNGKVVMVGNSMVSGIDTTTAGQKSFTVTYEGHKYFVRYEVKYRVVFNVDGVKYEQLVLSANEIVVPTPPKTNSKGERFENLWSPAIPNVLTSNFTTTAVYKPISNEREDVYTWTGNGLIDLTGYTSGSGDVVVTLTDKDGNPVSASNTAGYDRGSDKVIYTVTDEELILSISGTGVTVNKSWRVLRCEEPTMSISGEAIGVYVGENRSQHKITTTKSHKSLPLRYSVSGNENAKLEEYNGYLLVTPMKVGVTEVTVVATNATNELESVTLTHYVVIKPESIFIHNATYLEYGLENIWTVGGYNTDGLTAIKALSTNSDKLGRGFGENVYFVTNNAGVSVSRDGKITFNSLDAKSEIVEITAVFGYKGVTVESEPMKIRCVFNGFNVYSYNDLWAETNKENPRPIVLQRSIKDDFAPNYTTMRSTYDLTYYKNIYGEGTPEYDAATTIKVLIQFKSNVYGNGYEINAHNATIGTLDSTGNPTDSTIFRGPVDFVAVSDGGMVSVKGQDNIVFGVYENVTLNNIILKSCELTPDDEGKLDLTDLNFAGTTVEVLGDNVTIEYSRLMNGRTVLRVFGDAKDAAKAIHVNVKNTVIKASREFSARIGSNRFVENANTASPKLPNDNGKNYSVETKKNYSGMTAEQKAAYDESFINTFVTFENVIFEDAGIFAIGIDSHFAGEALRNGSLGKFDKLLNGWTGLAKTSYGAKVTLKNDVRFYTWKPLEDVDSSTLIEQSNGVTGMLADIKFDVKEIIGKMKNDSNYSSIIYKSGEVEYVNAAIAFFGGGKNYGVVDNQITSEFNPNLQSYDITLEAAGQGIFEKAAGSEPFYFLVYDINSGFNYDNQISLPADQKYASLRK